jgi:WD40 repeat protein
MLFCLAWLPACAQLGLFPLFENTNPTDRGQPDPQQNGLMIWDVKAWKQVAYLPVPYGVTRLVFSPRSDFLLTASETGEILLWSINP